MRADEFTLLLAAIFGTFCAFLHTRHGIMGTQARSGHTRVLQRFYLRYVTTRMLFSPQFFC